MRRIAAPLLLPLLSILGCSGDTPTTVASATDGGEPQSEESSSSPGSTPREAPTSSLPSNRASPSTSGSERESMTAALALLEPEQEGDLNPERFARAIGRLHAKLEGSYPAQDAVFLALALLHARYAPPEVFAQASDSPPAPTLDDGSLREPVERAVGYLEKAVEANPSNRAALRLLGFLLENLDDARAVSTWQQLVTLQPDHLEGLGRLGEGLLVLKRYDEAEKVGNRALSLAEGHGNDKAAGQARNVLGRVYLKTGRYDLAERMFKDAAVRNDGSHWGCAYQSLGQLYSTLGELDASSNRPLESSGTATVGSTKLSSDPLAAYRTALDHHDDGKMAEALEQIREARRQGDRPEFLAVEGLLLLALGQEDAARRALTKAAGQAPDCPGPKVGLAELAMRRGDSREAERQVLQAIDSWQTADVSGSGLARYFTLIHSLACHLHGRLRIEQKNAGGVAADDASAALAQAVCGMNVADD